MIVEIGGDLFDIINNIDDLLEPYYSYPKMYSNPAMSGSNITLEYNDGINDALTLNLVDYSGRMFSIDNHRIQSNKIIINLPALTSGVYILNVSDGINSIQNKLYINS